MARHRRRHSILRSITLLRCALNISLIIYSMSRYASKCMVCQILMKKKSSKPKMLQRRRVGRSPTMTLLRNTQGLLLKMKNLRIRRY